LVDSLLSVLAVGSYGFSRVEQRRVVRRASGGFAIKRLNASEDECPAPPSSFHLSFVGSFLSPSSTHPPPAPPPPGFHKDTPAFMPHYHCFETHHGGPMSFFIALLLAARFTEPAQRRASQKLPRRDSTKSRRPYSFSIAATRRQVGNQVASSMRSYLLI